MSKLRNMRVIQIQTFRAVSSGSMTFDQLFGPGGFDEWRKAHDHLLISPVYDPPCLLWHEGARETWGHGQNVFIWAVKDGVTSADTAPYEVIEFPGGMFLVATGDEKEPEDLNETVSRMFKWIEDSDVFEYGDFPKSGMCNMPEVGGRIDKVLGIEQQQVFLPLKFRTK